MKLVASTKPSMVDTLLSVPPGLDRGLLSSVKQGNYLTGALYPVAFLQNFNASSNFTR
jgi:hypothetical protein